MTDLMEAVTALAKRRGIAFQSSEIYGGLRSSWDYGPLGVELRRNIRTAWWRSMVQLRDEIVGLEAAIIMSPRVWEASGHVAGFSDPLVECESCHRRFREDHLPEPPVCPNCGGTAFSEPRQFNMMFKTHMGPVEDDSGVTYLRPETAQGMFVDFPLVQTVARKKLPFGIAQIGKSFRNEITPGNFIFRTREFEQMEMEYFIEPGTDDEWFDYWVQRAAPVVPGPRRVEGQAPPAAARSGRAGALREGRDRHRVRVPVRLVGARGHREPDRLRPQGAPGGERPGARRTSTRRRTSGTCRTWWSRRSASIARC